MKYIFDEGDFCRSCRGEGHFIDRDPHTGIVTSDYCSHCNGTGYKAVVILDKEEGMNEDKFGEWVDSIRKISDGKVDVEYLDFEIGKNGGCIIRFTGINTPDPNKEEKE
jgi:hypothetical protein